MPKNIILCIFISSVSNIKDVVECIANSLTNDKIKGNQYDVRGAKSYTFDGFLDVLAKYCGQKNFSKCHCQCGVLENFFIGRTHDKNLLKMIQWHEECVQNYSSDPNYLEHNGLKESTVLTDLYQNDLVKPESYIEPYLFHYKRIVLD